MFTKRTTIALLLSILVFLPSCHPDSSGSGGPNNPSSLNNPSGPNQQHGFTFVEGRDFPRAAANDSGFFLLASSANNEIGNIIRRIDVNGASPQEFDFDTQTEGIQGAKLYPEDNDVKTALKDFLSGEDIFNAKICGLVQLDDKNVVAYATILNKSVGLIFDASGTTDFKIDRVITFPEGNNICRGTYDAANKVLYSINLVPSQGSSGKGLIATADLGLFSQTMKVIQAASTELESSKITGGADLLFGIKQYQDKLLLLGHNSYNSSNPDSALIVVPIVNKSPSLPNLKSVLTDNPVKRAHSCSLGGGIFADIAVDDNNRIYTSGTDKIVAWTLDNSGTPQKYDLDKHNAGIQPIMLGKSGWGGNRMINDRDSIFVLPYCKGTDGVDIQTTLSTNLPKKFSILEIKDQSVVAEYDMRYTDFIKKMLDGLQKYQDAKKAEGKKAAKFDAQSFFPIVYDFAISPKNILVIGISARHEESGLDRAGDVMFINRDTKKTAVFIDKYPLDMGKGGLIGLKLGSGQEKVLSTAVLWVKP